jgi:hypothetical protein
MTAVHHTVPAAGVGHAPGLLRDAAGGRRDHPAGLLPAAHTRQAIRRRLQNPFDIGKGQ